MLVIPFQSPGEYLRPVFSDPAVGSGVAGRRTRRWSGGIGVAVAEAVVREVEYEAGLEPWIDVSLTVVPPGKEPSSGAVRGDPGAGVRRGRVRILEYILIQDGDAAGIATWKQRPDALAGMEALRQVLVQIVQLLA